MDNQIQPEPFTRSGKIAVSAIVLGLLVIWSFAFYAYISLPSTVPVHFGIKGEPTRYGDKSEFLFIALAFTIAPFLILLIAKYRFTLINKYPYLVNLPAFYTNIYRIPKRRRAYWVNKYFEAVLWLGALLTIYLVLLEYTIYLSQIRSSTSIWVVVFSLLLPVFLLLPFLYQIFRISKDMADEAEKQTKS